MNITRRYPSSIAQLLAASFAIAIALSGCSRSADKSSSEDASAAAPTHEGQGSEITADPAMELVLKIGDKPQTLPLRELTIYQQKPAKAGATSAPTAPQTFELDGDGVMLAGRLPAGVDVAPATKFQTLVGQPLEVRTSGGGDPGFRKLSKITLPDGTVYRVEKGTVTVSKAFFHRGKYAGASGDVDLVLQQIKLGDTDDPNNKGDQPIGSPQPATGTFTAHASSVPFQSL
jgi:hypothetical protein